MNPEEPEWIEDHIPAPSAQEWTQTKMRVEADLAKPEQRLWPDGSVTTCPKCRSQDLAGRSDITLELPSRSHVVIFRHLQGARCRKCRYTVLEPSDQHAVEEEVGVSFHGDYEAKVSRIGSGSLGTYWPKDVARNLGLQPHDIARIHVIASDTAVVKFEKGPADAA